MKSNSKIANFVPALCFLIAGIALVINPNFLRDVLKILGIILLVAAVICFFVYLFQKDEMGRRLPRNMGSTIVLLIVGILCIIIPAFLSFLIPVFIGIVLISDGIYGCQGSFAVKLLGPKWIVGFIFSVLMVVLGTVIIIKHRYFMDTLHWFIGASLIVSAVFSITSGIISYNKE